MNTLNKKDVVKLLQSGEILIQKKYLDFGTKSLFSPIKRFNKFTSKFSICEKQINHKTGYSMITNLKKINIQKQGLVEIIEWTIK